MPADIHTLTGAYAADALQEDERLHFERHLLECGDCSQEVAELQATAARIGAAASYPAPAQLRTAVMARVASTRQDPPVVVHASPSARPSLPVITPPSIPILTTSGDELSRRRERRTTSWSRFGLAGIAASVVAAAVLGVTSVRLQGDLEQTRSALDDTRSSLQQTRSQAESVTQVLRAPDARTTSGRVTGGGHGTAVVSQGLGKAVFVAADIPELSERRVYQLWLIGTDGPRSVSVMNVSRVDEPVVFGGLGNADKIGLTVEPAGGSAQPTTTPVMLFPIAG